MNDKKGGKSMKKLIKEVTCFLQLKIPHFCKTFSSGTGGEFLC
jgi:hypothetical protein